MGRSIFEPMPSAKHQLHLRRLELGDEPSFLRALEDWTEADRAWFTWHWEPGVAFSDVLLRIDREATGSGLPEHLVPATMYYAFLGDQIVGRLHLRHRLNQALAVRGGHIGYAVAPKFRNQGFATEILRQGLSKAAALGVSSAMVTCANDNIASWKVIEKAGGQLEQVFTDEKNGEVVRKYWLSTGGLRGDDRNHHD